MKAVVPILAVVAVILALGAIFYFATAPVEELTQEEPYEQVNDEAENEDDDSEFCIQVITPAQNEDTGEIREFPTPCDVPEGWIVIENDIPNLELEVENETGY